MRDAFLSSKLLLGKSSEFSRFHRAEHALHTSSVGDELRREPASSSRDDLSQSCLANYQLEFLRTNARDLRRRDCHNDGISASQSGSFRSAIQMMRDVKSPIYQALSQEIRIHESRSRQSTSSIQFLGDLPCSRTCIRKSSASLNCAPHRARILFRSSGTQT